ncbi:MAG: TetR family transcriptional regulator [Herminiimonas sp.]|nr:TetR family transcriptional regulator [Herminiimonas sp.]
MNAPQKRSFKQQQLIVREDAIIDAVNGLLAKKGYDLMTMDEVAAEVGIAKASLYKHFPSKEALAAAAMIRLLENTLTYVRSLDPAMPALARLRSILQWALEVRMAGGLPTLPAENTTLRDSLVNNFKYVGKVLDMNELLGDLIEQAKKDGAIRIDLPTEVVLFTIYARSCDPSVDYLKMMGQYTDQQIVDFLLLTCFNGLGPDPSPAHAPK